MSFIFWTAGMCSRSNLWKGRYCVTLTSTTTSSLSGARCLVQHRCHSIAVNLATDDWSSVPIASPSLASCFSSRLPPWMVHRRCCTVATFSFRRYDRFGNDHYDDGAAVYRGRHLSTQPEGDEGCENLSEEAAADEEKAYTCSVEDLGSTVFIRRRHPNDDVDTDADSKEAPVSSKFHAAWLWSNDPLSIHPTSGQRTRSPSTYLSGGWRIASAEIVIVDSPPTSATAPPPPRGCLHPVGGVYPLATLAEKFPNRTSREMLSVTWKKKGHKGGEETGLEHSSQYDLDWLWQCRYDDMSLLRRRRATEIRKEHAIRRETALWESDYDALMSPPGEGVGAEGDEARYLLLHALVRDGAALVKNAPIVTSQEGDGDSETIVARVGRLLSGGGLSHGELYGDTFHVRSVPGALNIAYTDGPLPPHQDLAYYESKPGFQLLHCVQNASVVGGESVLIDGMSAASELQRLAPDLFDVLLRTEATFIKQRPGADMILRRPHVQVDSSGSVVSFAWSPPFEGPLVAPSHHVDDYYLAYAALERMLDDSIKDDGRLSLSDGLLDDLRRHAMEHTWERRLDPGDLLVFNNQRMLHGRRGFRMLDGNDNDNGDDHDTTGTAGRHLIGCYIGMEDTLNQYRLLRRERLQRSDHPRSDLFVPNVGNGGGGAN